MKITFTTLLAFLVLSPYAQSITRKDLSGTWVGSSTFMKDHIPTRLELVQENGAFTAVLYNKDLKRNDSSKFKMSGVAKGRQIDLKGDSVVYAAPWACMANLTLNLVENGNQLTLTGRWKGDGKFTTCPPLLGGSISLTKIQNPTISSVGDAPLLATRSDQQVIEEKDAIGKALLSELSKRKYYALVIGVNEYTSESINDLEHPIGDAEMLAGTLTTFYSFDRENVYVLKNPTRAEIINQLDILTSKVEEKDHLLIFYAGHGVWNEQLNQGYWLPSDASMQSKSHWLSNSTLRDYVGGIQSKHTLLISDACFSGGILKERAVFDNSRAILEVYKLPSRKAMTSGTLKTVPDKSVFIKYLVKNLRDNTSPLLSADQLFRTFKTAVINNSPNGQVPQYGPIAQTGDEGGDFVFLRKE